MKKKIFVFIIGTLFSILLLEGSLRLAGQLNHKDIPRNQEYDTSLFNILCIGNSFTKGHGAPSDQSFPVYLQKMFNQYYGTKRINVINQGQSGWNTFQILKNLTSFVNAYKPDMIILRAGGPNEFNYTGYPYTIIKKDYFIHQISKYIKSFYFVQLLLKTIHEKPRLDTNSKLKSSPAFNDTEEWFNQCYDPELLAACDDKKHDSKKISTALSIYKHIIKENPRDYIFYGKISALYLEFQSNIINAIDTILTAVNILNSEQNQKAQQYWRQYFYYRLNNIKSFVSKDSSSYSNLAQAMKELESAVPFNERIAPYKEGMRIEEWIEQDLVKIVTKIKKLNIPLIIHNYPPRPPSSPKRTREVNRILEKISKTYDVTFLDIEKNFFEKEHKGIDTSQYYFQFNNKLDFHLNAQGYKLNASYLFNIIIKNKLKLGLPQKSI